MKQKWLDLSIGQKVIFCLQVVLIVLLDDPNAAEILRLIYAPDVTRRANPLGLICGTVLCTTCMVSLLFADYFFRRNLAFRIRNPEDAEPSEWELFSRWIGWLLFTGMAIAIFILGLTGA